MHGQLSAHKKADPKQGLTYKVLPVETVTVLDGRSSIVQTLLHIFELSENKKF